MARPLFPGEMGSYSKHGLKGEQQRQKEGTDFETVYSKCRSLRPRGAGSFSGADVGVPSLHLHCPG